MSSGNYPQVWMQDRGHMVNYHIVAAERALGKRLPKGAQVHHVDEDPRNFRNDNLVILQNQTEHLALHRRMRIIRSGGNPWTQQICSSCKEVKTLPEFYPSDARCKECISVRMCQYYYSGLQKC